MSAELGWKMVRGDELSEAFASASRGVRELLPERSAVYVWKRSLRGLTPRSADPAALVAWLERQVTTPQGRIAGHRVGHFIRLGEVELRAGRLSPVKRQSLERFARKPMNRRWLIAYVEQLSRHAPALYVGEAGNVRLRCEAHLRGDTDFGADVRDLPYLAWDDLDLYYYDLGPAGPETNQFRKAIEFITAAVTIGGFTRRPG